MPRLSIFALLSLCLVAAACDPPPPPSDAGTLDGGAPPMDSGPRDSGRGDAGPLPDAGPPVDAGPLAPFDPFAALDDPYLIARPLPGQMRLVSSREPEAPDGEGNADERNFVRVEGSRRVLADLSGPGVITRLWFTSREPATLDYTVLDRNVLHVVIDGEEVEFDEGVSGVRFDRLCSGDLPGFGPDWVADRSRASDAMLSSVPIAYADSALLYIDDIPGVDTSFYYQIEYREMPPQQPVMPFVMPPTPAQIAHLDAAGARLRDGIAAGATAPLTATVAPGEDATISLAGATVVSALRVRFPQSRSGDLRVSLDVDGERIVDSDPLLRLFFAQAPAEDYASAFAVVASGEVSLRYPIVVDSNVGFSVENSGSSPVEIELAVQHDTSADRSELGRLRVNCFDFRTPAIGENFTVLDVDGARGHYVGQSFALDAFHRTFWALEGDHELYVDGEPAILGTGAEDYFGGAYYYRIGPMRLLLAGATGRLDRSDGTGTVHQYRHHQLGTVPFESSFRFTYETFSDDENVDGCAFWYED